MPALAQAWQPDRNVEVVVGTAAGGSLDAGEWKATVGRYRDLDGSMKLLITGPPLTGMHLVPGTADGKATLTLRTPQQEYVFVRVK